jgi:hypothetical protein
MYWLMQQWEFWLIIGIFLVYRLDTYLNEGI